MCNFIKRTGIIVVYCIIAGILIVVMGNPSLVNSQGPRGLQRPGSGMGMGMGLQRGFGFQAGRGGMNLQRGIMQEPPYCRMLMDRPDLNLTPKQRDDIKNLQIKYMKRSLDLKTDLQINKIELRKLRFSEKPDFGLIKAKLEKISKLQLDLQIKRSKLQIDADKILTKAQKDSLFLSPCTAIDIEWEDYMESEEMSGPGLFK